MTFYPVTQEKLEQTLAARINEAEAELGALESVIINTDHKTLTNRAVSVDDDMVRARIGGYLGDRKALYVSYEHNHSYKTFNLIVYTYNNPDGSEIGVEGIMRIWRKLTPLELRELLDELIAGRRKDLRAIKVDFVHAKQITANYNRLAEQMNQLLSDVTSATRGVLQ